MNNLNALWGMIAFEMKLYPFADKYRDGEVSCEVSGTNIINFEENSSCAVPKSGSSTTSTTSSGKTTVNEIYDIVEEISSRMQHTTFTYERLNRIRTYFAKSKAPTIYELDALKWLTDNMQTIYNDPINACKKLCIAVGSECIPIDFAKKVLWSFVKNHTICTTDMIKYCTQEKRKEITINELSQILKRLIKMNIKRVLLNDSDSISTVASGAQ